MYKRQFIDHQHNGTIREALLRLIGEMKEAGTFAALHAEDDVPKLIRLTHEETIAEKLRKLYRESGDFATVIREEIVV